VDYLYDSWWCQGTSDSAIGVGIVLAIAKYMKQLKETYNITPKYNVKFILFGGEEYGYIGARSYESRHSDENITAVIDINQVGFTQSNPRLTTNIITNKFFLKSLTKEIGERTKYVEKTGDMIDFETWWVQFGAPSNDNPFAVNRVLKSRPVCKTMCFLKDHGLDKTKRWILHHRDGENHTEGDVLKYFNWTDVNATADMVFNTTKFFAYDPPKVWFENNPNIDPIDTTNDGVVNYDCINISYVINTTWPNEQVTVRAILYPKRQRWHPFFPILYRLREEKEYVINSGETEGYINISLPNRYPKGEYKVNIFLVDSHNETILDSLHLLGMEVGVDGLEILQYIKNTFGSKIPDDWTILKKVIFKDFGIDIEDFIKSITNLRDKKIRDFLIDMLCFKYNADKYKSAFEMHPPNRAPNAPDEPIDLGLGEFGKLHRYKTKATDPDPGDLVQFQWNWSGIKSPPTPRPSLQNRYHKEWHKWWSKGQKTIKVRAKNPLNPNVYSNWSKSINVTINESCFFNVATSHTNQKNINNPHIRNSYDPSIVVVDDDISFWGFSVGFSETPEYGYKIQGAAEDYTDDQNIENYDFDEVGDKYVNFTAESGGTKIYYNQTLKVVNISACFNMSQLGAQPNQTIIFNDTTISKYAINNWTWDFGDGNFNYSQNASHNYSATGVYNVTLNVTDTNNEVATFWQIVHVESNPPEIIDASCSPIPGTLGCDITLFAEFYDNNGSGLNVVNVNISYPNGTTNNFTMYENKNCSYGYEYVFNDTMQVGWYYFTIWVTDLANNTNNHSGFGFQILPAFGYSPIGYFSKNIKDNISGSRFTMFVNGTAESITAYIQTNLSTPPKTKCMIYRANDSILLDTTEQKILNTGEDGTWITYNFSDPKANLTTNSEYIIVCWSNDTCNLSYDNASNDLFGRYKSQTYGNPPNDISSAGNESRLYSIYCTYSTVPEVNSSSVSSDPIGFGYSTTINAEIEHYYTLVENISVNITYSNNTNVNHSMTKVDDDTFQYIFNDAWVVGQYNYSVWVQDGLGANCTSSGYNFNVSADATISVCTVKDTYGNNETINITDPPGEPPQIGYELLDKGEVLHIWNKYDSYYFDTDSGIQLTNHYDEYWSHNVLMLWYYNNDKWNLIYRTDELTGFNKDIDRDNETYVNATLWKDLIYKGYEFRLAIRYHLGIDDNELTVIPYIKNIDDENIPYILGFGWEMKDIQIDMTSSGDYIDVNHTMYYLNQTLNNTYTDLLESEFYLMENITAGRTKSLYLKWDETLPYKLRVKSRTGQYNAPVTLFVRIGTLGVDQEKSTEMYWYDADQKTYYFNSYDNTEDWETNPSNMVAGNPSNHSSTTADGDIELCDGNTCPGNDLGDISKVELRVSGYYSGSMREIILRPVFGGTTDGFDIPYLLSSGTSAWSPWFDITNDPNAPQTWSWTDINNLDCDVAVAPGMPEFTLYCSKIEVRVTYSTHHPPEITNPYPSDGSSGVSLTPTLNITVSDDNGDSMDITWLSNSSGSWQSFGTNNSVSNGTYRQTFSNATENGKWWYWKVNVSDGTNYTVSSVYKFYTGYRSKIVNTGSTAFKGYLLIQVQYYNNSSTWIVVDNTINENTPRTVDYLDQQGQNVLALDTIFNGLVNTANLSSYGNGTYRIYAAFRDPDGNILKCDDETELEAIYEFTITFE
jgi:YHS domain-containing protein